jgi:hypothetical protein
MFDLLKPFLARIAGAIAGFIVTFLSAHEIAVLTPDDTATLVSFIVLVFMVIYGIVHKIIDKKINPADTAVAPSKTNIKVLPPKVGSL